MASRFRIFVKKRGTRRTGPRWMGMLIEALVAIALVLVGAYGIFWLFERAVGVDGPGTGWWPWALMIIPVSLVGYGGTHLVQLLWRSAVSTERRAAVVQKASEWEMPGAQLGTGRPLLPAVPSIDAVVDSAGVHLAYRLPIDAASGWVSFTMAAVSLGWITLVGILFMFNVVGRGSEEPRNWLLTWMMVPFVLAGIWTLLALGRQMLLTAAVGATRLEVSQHPFVPGHTYRGFVSQTGRLHFRWFQVQLICEEQAIYQQGTDTRRATQRVYRNTAFSQRKFDITPRQAFESSFEFTIPTGAMHSFVSTHNAVMWSLVVRGRTARWGELERRFPVYVYPALSPGSAPAGHWEPNAIVAS
ncbi:MAG: hypothetical protein WD468_06330 [Pirellulales bacterium]